MTYPTRIPSPVSVAQNSFATASVLNKASNVYKKGARTFHSQAMGLDAALLTAEARVFEKVAQDALEVAVEEEDENGIECCGDMESAHCVSCKMGITLREFCTMDGIRRLSGCGSGMPEGKCGVGVPSPDGSVCCDVDHCDGKCGGKGCAGLFGGPSHCCVSAIRVAGEGCDTHNPPCVQGSGHIYGNRGLYELPSQSSLSVPRSVARLYSSRNPVFYDDGTEIALERGCNLFSTCSSCAHAGCTWIEGTCHGYQGESECGSE